MIINIANNFHTYSIYYLKWAKMKCILFILKDTNLLQVQSIIKITQCVQTAGSQ